MSEALTENGAIVKWIFNRINTDTVTFSVDSNSLQKTLAQFVGNHPTQGIPQIYRNVSPVDARVPFIIFIRMGGRVRKGNGGRIVTAKHVYGIKLVSESSMRTEAKYLAQRRLRTLFQQAQNTQDTTVIGCSVDDFIDYNESSDGVKLDHVGVSVQLDTYNLDD